MDLNSTSNHTADFKAKKSETKTLSPWERVLRFLISFLPMWLYTVLTNTLIKIVTVTITGLKLSSYRRFERWQSIQYDLPMHSNFSKNAFKQSSYLRLRSYFDSIFLQCNRIGLVDNFSLTHQLQVLIQENRGKALYFLPFKSNDLLGPCLNSNSNKSIEPLNTPEMYEISFSDLKDRKISLPEHSFCVNYVVYVSPTSYLLKTVRIEKSEHRSLDVLLDVAQNYPDHLLVEA